MLGYSYLLHLWRAVVLEVLSHFRQNDGLLNWKTTKLADHIGLFEAKSLPELIFSPFLEEYSQFIMRWAGLSTSSTINATPASFQVIN